jgi:hypothetical protein
MTLMYIITFTCGTHIHNNKQKSIHNNKIIEDPKRGIYSIFKNIFPLFCNGYNFFPLFDNSYLVGNISIEIY